MKKIIGLIILLVAGSGKAIQKKIAKKLSEQDAIGMMQQLRPMIVEAAKKIRADLDDYDYERLKKILNANNTADILQFCPKNKSKIVIIDDQAYAEITPKSVIIQLSDTSDGEEFELRRAQVLIIALAPDEVESDQE